MRYHTLVRSVSGNLQVLHVTYSTVPGHQGRSVTSANTYQLTDITPENVFNLFLLEPALNDQPPATVHTAACAQFGKQELNDVFWLAVHLFADVANIDEQGALTTFSLDVWRCNRISLLAATTGKRRVR